MFDLWLQVLKDTIFFKNRQIGDGRGAAKRITAIAVTIKKGLFMRAQESRENPFGREGSRQWQVTTSQCVGDRQKVWVHPFVLAGEILTGSIQTGHDLIEDQKNVMVIAPSPQRFQDTGWPQLHP